MPTKREREYYRMGFSDGLKDARRDIGEDLGREVILRDRYGQVVQSRRKPKRKLSAWNKFVKANSKKKEFRYRDGKLNLKKMGVAFRRKKRR
jgi:hypothetical protein